LVCGSVVFSIGFYFGIKKFDENLFKYQFKAYETQVRAYGGNSEEKIKADVEMERLICLINL
jgi:hypothetical protein